MTFSACRFCSKTVRCVVTMSLELGRLKDFGRCEDASLLDIPCKVVTLGAITKDSLSMRGRTCLRIHGQAEL